MWKNIFTVIPEETRAHSYWGEAIYVWTMWKVIFTTVKPDPTRTHSYRGEKTSVWTMWKGIFPKGEPEITFAHSYWGEAIYVWTMWKVIFTTVKPDPTRTHSYRREATPVQLPCLLLLYHILMHIFVPSVSTMLIMYPLQDGDTPSFA